MENSLIKELKLSANRARYSRKERTATLVARSLQVSTIVQPGMQFVKDGGIWTVLRQGRGAWVCQEFAHGTTCEFYTSQILVK